MTPPRSTGPGFSRRTFLLGGATAGIANVGTFTAASAAPIEAGVDVVRTSGFASPGRGGAVYVADEQVTPAYVAANPRTAFLSAGRGFRLSLDQIITPHMFGAVGFTNFTQSNADFQAITDSTAELQAFFDFCAVQRVESANWGGVFGVSSGLRLGGPTLSEGGKSEESFRSTDSFQGDLVLAVKPGSNINVVLTNNARRGASFGPISIVGPHDGGLHSNRLFDIGILFQNKAQNQVWTSGHFAFARYAGILIQNGRNPYDNTYNNHLQSLSFYRCGSGATYPGAFASTTFSGRVDTGVAGGAADDVFQYSTITVGAMHPAWIDTYGATPDFTALPLLVRIGGDIYAVRSFDRASKTLTIFPWLPNGVDGGTLQWVWGGGLVIKGGDVAITTGKLTAFNCSVGYFAAANYNGHFTATMQDNYIGMAVGRYYSQGARGGTTHAYWEGNDIDLLWNGREPSNHEIESSHNYDPAKTRSFTPRRRDGTLVPWINRKLVINTEDYRLTYENERDINGGWFGALISFDRPNGNIIPLHGDGPTITVAFPASTLLMDRYGYRARTVQVVGNGANREPTLWVDVVPQGGKRINGGAPGAPLRLTGFTGPATIQLSLDPAHPLDNCIVAIMGGR